MNRQVLPSMVLSVLIVCFFAVVLFPVERDREQAEGDRRAPASAGPLAASHPAASPAAEPAPASKPEPEPTAPVVLKPSTEPTRSAEVVERTEETPPSPPPSSSSSGAAPSVPATVKEAPAPAPAPPPVPVPVPVPEPSTFDRPYEPPAVDATPKEKPSVPATVEKPAARPGPIAIPRSDPEVTVVQEGETLEDVAVRVYGSRSSVEALYRANRDVLTRRKGPLRTGLPLWTPEH